MWNRRTQERYSTEYNVSTLLTKNADPRPAVSRRVGSPNSKETHELYYKTNTIKEEQEPRPTVHGSRRMGTTPNICKGRSGQKYTTCTSGRLADLQPDAIQSHAKWQQPELLHANEHKSQFTVALEIPSRERPQTSNDQLPVRDSQRRTAGRAYWAKSNCFIELPPSIS